MPDEALGYSIPFDNVQIGLAPADIITIIPAAGYRVAILDFSMGPVEGTVAAGDANEQFGRWSIVRGHPNNGALGAVINVRAMNPDRQGSHFTARSMDTTLANGGTPETLHADSFPVRGGIIYRPKKFAYPRCRPEDITLIIRLLAALTTPVRCSGTLYLAEYDAASMNLLERT